MSSTLQKDEFGRDIPGTGTTIDGVGDDWTATTSTSPFTFLSLNVPPQPLFRDSEGMYLLS